MKPKLTHLPQIQCRITSEFGERNFAGMNWHNGVDIGALHPGVEGDPLYAVADGIVVVCKYNGGSSGYGYYAVIEHNGFCTLYAHMQPHCIAAGQKVSSGDIIGHMGSTGASTAPHLHFEIRDCPYNDDFWLRSGDKFLHCIDPLPYISEVLSHDDGTAKFTCCPEAIDYLNSIGVINTPSYWLNACKCIKYLDMLLINAANAMCERSS